VVALERLCLPARTVEREHVQAPEPLAEGLLLDERLELCDELVLAPAFEVSLDPLLEDAETLLLEAPDLALREGLVGEVGERRPSPERQRGRQRP